MALSARAAERAVLLAAAAYVVAFLALQLPDLLDTRFLEWDARAWGIATARFHGTGLFPDDLTADLIAAMSPPGWRPLYWVMTLFVSPYLATKLLPFPLFLTVLWQGYALGRHLGGRVLGAGTAVLLCHCGVFWDRIVGANPRAFGYPLVIAFLRYASEGRERATLTVLVLQAAFYPSAFLFCAPAYGVVTLLSRDLRRMARLAGAGAIAAALLLPSVWLADPRIGKPITVEQLAALGQRENLSLYPVPPWRWVAGHVVRVSLYEVYGRPLVPRLSAWPPVEDGRVTLVLVAAALVMGRRALARLRPIVPALLVASVVAFAAAQALAYRLFIPERILKYAWPPVFLAALPVFAMEALRPLARRHAALVAVIVLAGVQLTLHGSGLARRYGVHDWSARDTPTTRFLSTLPAGVLVAAGLEESSDIQVFARRQTLFSAMTNLPHFDAYAVEMERRIGDYYGAYYVRDPAQVRDFAARYGVHYLVGDARDFGPAALERALYAEPWTSLARDLLARGPIDQLVLAKPPEGAIVFADGPRFVLDLRKL